MALLLALTFALCIFSACGEEKKEYSMPVKVTSKNADGEIQYAQEIVYDGDTMTITWEDGSKDVVKCTDKKEEVQMYDEDGSRRRIRKTEYDSDGRPTKITETRYATNGQSSGHTSKYEYHNDGTRTCIMTNKEGYYTREETKFDENGYEAEIYYYYEDGSLSSYRIYEYDEYGNVTKDTSYNADGTVSMYYAYTYEYDKDGNITKRTTDHDNSISYTVYEYDESGNLIKTASSDKDGSMSDTKEYEYATVALTEAQYRSFLAYIR